MSNPRNIPIDIAKGISIILVAFGHSKLSKIHPAFHEALSLIRMPLFFFLSGIFFSTKLSAGKYMLKKSDALLKPYFGTMLIAVIFLALDNSQLLNRALVGIFYSTGHTLWSQWIPLWFLTHLWLIFMVAYLLTKFTSFQSLDIKIRLFITLSVLLVGGLFSDQLVIFEWDNIKKGMVMTGLPFSIDLLPITLSYFLLGTAVKDQVLDFKPHIGLLGFLVVCYACILLFTDAHMNLHARIFDNFIFASIGSLIGIYLVLSLSYYLSLRTKTAQILSTIGFSSLFILIFHGIVRQETYQLLKKVISNKPKYHWYWVSLAMSIYLPILMRSVALRVKYLRLIYFPSGTPNPTSKRLE